MKIKLVTLSIATESHFGLEPAFWNVTKEVAEHVAKTLAIGSVALIDEAYWRVVSGDQINGLTTNWQKIQSKFYILPHNVFSISFGEEFEGELMKENKNV